MENISLFDIISISLILILGIKGIVNGLIKEISGLVGVVGGIYIAARYAQSIGFFIDNNIYAFENKTALYLIGFVATLLLFWIFSIFIGYIFSRLLSVSGLSGLDKMGGFIIGSLKIFLVFSVLAIALTNIEFVRLRVQPYMSKSFMYPIFIETGRYIIKLDTSKVVGEIKNSANKIY